MGIAINGNTVNGLAIGGQAFLPVKLTYIGLSPNFGKDGAMKYDQNGQATGTNGGADYWANATIIYETTINGQKFVQAKAPSGTTAYFKVEDLGISPVDGTYVVTQKLRLSLNTAISGNATVLRADALNGNEWYNHKLMLAYSFLENDGSNNMTVSGIFELDNSGIAEVDSITGDGEINILNFGSQYFQINTEAQRTMSGITSAFGYLYRFAD